MKKIILVTLLSIFFIDSAISQQVLESRSSYSLIKSTNERLYMRTYEETHRVFLPIVGYLIGKKEGLSNGYTKGI
jgi:hypothetical protein